MSQTLRQHAEQQFSEELENLNKIRQTPMPCKLDIVALGSRALFTGRKIGKWF